MYLANYECHYSASITHKSISCYKTCASQALCICAGSWATIRTRVINYSVYKKSETWFKACCLLPTAKHEVCRALLCCRFKSGQLTSHYATKMSQCFSSYLPPVVSFAWSYSRDGIIRQLVTALLVLITLHRLPLNQQYFIFRQHKSITKQYLLLYNTRVMFRVFINLKTKDRLLIKLCGRNKKYFCFSAGSTNGGHI